MRIHVTTFFDRYALPRNFPELTSEAAAAPDPVARAAAIEAGFHAAVVAEAGRRPDRFLPHLQPFEFEGLPLSDTSRFAEAEPAWKPLGKLEVIRRSAPTPEHINDGPATHPPARLTQILRPRYRKTRRGAAAAARIGLEPMRAECAHFGRRVTRLEGATA